MMKRFFLAIIAAGFVQAGSAMAGEAAGGAKGTPYSADDVVKFMLAQSQLGAARSVCIGAEEECAAPKLKGFDMVINFQKDSAELTPDAQRNLNSIAAALADPRLGDQSFKVEGYTDASGSDSHNMKLSKARAGSVETYLVSKNIPAERLSAIGLGKSQPRTEDPLDPQNRRVELKLDLH
jgi:peptidoglycan-associated lipoprotein